MPSDMEMTCAPSSRAQWMARARVAEEPPPSPSTLPMRARLMLRATPMRVPATSLPKMVPAQWLPWPCRSWGGSSVKLRCTSCTPAKAGWLASMPVSSTATLMPLPS